jgi:hypothetical protein
VGIRCHAGLDPASSLDFWIPAFAGMTIRRKRVGYSGEGESKDRSSTVNGNGLSRDVI